MNAEVLSSIRGEVTAIQEAGLEKRERLIASPQGALIRVGGREVLNFCANNYLGLGNDPRGPSPRPAGVSMSAGFRAQLGPLHLRHPGHPP